MRIPPSSLGSPWVRLQKEGRREREGERERRPGDLVPAPSELPAFLTPEELVKHHGRFPPLSPENRDCKLMMGGGQGQHGEIFFMSADGDIMQPSGTPLETRPTGF